MVKLFALIQTYKKEEDGATAIEYGLIAAGIALFIAGSVWAFGADLDALFQDMSASLAGAP
ncbi:MAG: Flp family type IVb pilin [Pseudobdellovibrionaceae bacterium]